MSEARAHDRIVAGRYAIYGPIATGGMATVCYARLLGPGGFARTVAVKKLHREHLETPEMISTLIDEARLASRIRHPNVVATLDMLTDDDEVLLVMEYVPGESLARLLATLRQSGQRLDIPVAAGIVTGMLDGLHAAHEARDERGEPLGIVHRDVTPENVLVGSDGLARLLDFGIAKGKGRLQTTRAGQLKGKMSYMAPEQILGEDADRRSDVYSAAVVFWEALTGLRLFPGGETSADSVQLIPRILEADLHPPSHVAPWIPRTLDPVVMRGLNREREARYPTAREFAAAIEHASGVATPRRVADWIDSVAGPTLRARAAELAAIERAAEQRDPGPMLETTVRRRRDKQRANSAQADAKTDPEPWRARDGGSVEDLHKTIQLHDEETTQQNVAAPPTEKEPLEEDSTTAQNAAAALSEAQTRVYERNQPLATPPDLPIAERPEVKPSDLADPSFTQDTVDLPVTRSSFWPWLIAAIVAVAIAAALWLRSR